MSNESEAAAQYSHALKLGRKAHRDDVHRGNYPYLQVLDEILDSSMIVGKVSVGLVDIPSEMIIGTKTSGRTTAFASNFMPLLPEDTEFAAKWESLCALNLGDEGIRDPIRCYEYLGRFYVQEGNKRASVLKSFDSPTIPGYVIRLIPQYSGEPEIRRYYEFLKYYPLTGLYQIYFTCPGSFAKLQTALGYESDHCWTDDEKRVFRSAFYNFSTAFSKLKTRSMEITAADALLVWLKVYSFDTLRYMPQNELLSSLQRIWHDVELLCRPEPIAVSTEADAEEAEPGFLGRLKNTVFPLHLKAAFIHEFRAEDSTWTQAHELGRKYMLSQFGTQVETMVYMGVGSGAGAESAMEDAISRGAQVIFATTVSLIAVCRKIAVKYPSIKILNCSISMPYTGVRTYYSRIYEGKFISGAIAGAISRSDSIGYIASYPIFGVPAGINAFALGAQLTNPRARLELKWFCVPGDPVKELTEAGVDVVSTLDIPMPGWDKGQWGSFRLLPDGSTELLASPYWNWGEFYVKLIRTILDGSWDSMNSGSEGQQAVNYWWGMASGVIGVKLSDSIPPGVAALAQILQNSIKSDSITPFHRPFRSQDGTVRNDGSKYFTHEEILHMDWLCENVNGSIPPFESLASKSRNIVRLQGIYRDKISPDKEDVIL